MATLLQIDSSGLSDSSTTRKLSAHYADKWKEANPNGKIIQRNLSETNVPFATEALIFAMNTAPDKLTSSQKLLLSLPDELMKELLEAETYVIGAPMYNFSIPAILKAYIDAIVRPGLTFSYDGGKPKGLLKNKKVIVVTASGGDYSQAPMKNMDFVEPYLRTIFGFIGITDVTFVKAHGNDPQTKSATESAAKTAIDALFQRVTA
ncbi:MAG: NAD(P)H-dependent oxidoreductase [Candidatus Obscuribacterales bacterium]|nr:NAD(P)H-dependent oxidoreductase [Candidatus Obscuribacterales bacterium]